MTTTTLSVPLIICLLHFLFDWKFQSNWMAMGKSKSVWILTLHAFVATLYCALWGIQFWTANFFFHLLTDGITSRLTSKLWFIDLAPFRFSWEELSRYENRWASVYCVNFDERKRHWFFVTIGFDQFLHYAALAITWHLLVVGE